MSRKCARCSFERSATDLQLWPVACVALPSMPHSGEQVSATALLQHGSLPATWMHWRAAREKNGFDFFRPNRAFWHEWETESSRLMHLSTVLEDDRSPRLGLIGIWELTKMSCAGAIWHCRHRRWHARTENTRTRNVLADRCWYNLVFKHPRTDKERTVNHVFNPHYSYTQDPPWQYPISVWSPTLFYLCTLKWTLKSPEHWTPYIQWITIELINTAD